MATVLIGYDLKKPGQDYSALYEAIKKLGAWWHHLDSIWLVVGDSLTASGVRDGLQAHIDSNDELLVIEVTGDARAWTGFNDSGSTWLKELVRVTVSIRLGARLPLA
jgi:hypothetical protein